MVVLKRKLAEHFQLKFTKVRSGIKLLFRIRIWNLLTKMSQMRPDLESGSEPATLITRNNNLDIL